MVAGLAVLRPGTAPRAGRALPKSGSSGQGPGFDTPRALCNGEGQQRSLARSRAARAIGWGGVLEACSILTGWHGPFWSRLLATPQPRGSGHDEAVRRRRVAKLSAGTARGNCPSELAAGAVQRSLAAKPSVGAAQRKRKAIAKHAGIKVGLNELSCYPGNNLWGCHHPSMRGRSRESWMPPWDGTGWDGMGWDGMGGEERRGEEREGKGVDRSSVRSRSQDA
ncbi:MAG: hypothetical protein PWR07_1883 [Bacillota bacterium]|nr:hypothetical protein [Bacillota bacterium]